MNNNIQILKLTTVKELEEVQKLEELIWHSDIIPIHQTITVVQNGGIMLGAYNELNQLIGFSYSFPGVTDGQLSLCSHMLGIHPDYRSKGIGAQLKKKQKEFALELGYDLITWTYDPLESKNAYLNLTKLHAFSKTYINNCYGEMEDSLNKGLPTDRLKVEWWINSKGSNILETSAVNHFLINFNNKYPFIEHVDDTLTKIHDDKQVLVPIPANFQEIKNEDNALAQKWRFQIREIFHSLFSKDYLVVSLVKGEKDINYYMFKKQE